MGCKQDVGKQSRRHSEDSVSTENDVGNKNKKKPKEKYQKGEKQKPKMSNNAQLIENALQDLQKAITETSVSGLLLVREDLQAEMAIMAPTDTPLRNRLNRIQGNGKAHSWYKLVPNSQPEGLFLGTPPSAGFFANGGLPTGTTPSYKHVSAPYSSLGDLATVSFFDQMAGGTYTDIKKHQLKVKMLNVALMEEWAIINGDSGVNALAFDGLRVQTTTNVKDNANAPLALNDLTAIMQTIVEKGGKPQAVVASYREIRRISELVLSSFYRLVQAGAGSLADVSAGVSVTKWTSPFGVVDIIGSRYIVPAGAPLVADVLVVDDVSVLEDGNAVQMVDLMPLSAIDLALLQSAYRTLVAEFTVLQMTAEAFQGKIINVGP